MYICVNPSSLELGLMVNPTSHRAINPCTIPCSITVWWSPRSLPAPRLSARPLHYRHAPLNPHGAPPPAPRRVMWRNSTRDTVAPFPAGTAPSGRVPDVTASPPLVTLVARRWSRFLRSPPLELVENDDHLETVWVVLVFVGCV